MDTEEPVAPLITLPLRYHLYVYSAGLPGSAIYTLKPADPLADATMVTSCG